MDRGGRGGAVRGVRFPGALDFRWPGALWSGWGAYRGWDGVGSFAVLAHSI